MKKKVAELFKITVAQEATVEVKDGSAVLDPHYHFDALLVRKALLWFKGTPGFQNLGIVGNAGTGKTSFLKEFCSRMGADFRSISVSGDTRFESLFGRREIRNGSTEYVETGLAQMARSGGVFCANEFFRMDPGESMRLVDIMDVGGSITNPETGEVIPRHPDFRFCFTGNSGGFGDETGAYAGERRGSFALRDRCTILELPELSETDESGIISRNVPTMKEYPDILEKMIKTARIIRGSFVGRGGGVCLDVSPRGLVRWAQIFYAYWSINSGPAGKVVDDPLMESLMDSCLNGAPDDQKNTVIELAKEWLLVNS